MPEIDLAEIQNRLAPVSLELDRILLDPNNPRLAEARGTVEPEEHTDDSEVQRDTLGRLKGTGGTDLDDLRASIATVGFLPISFLIVRKHFKSESNKYVVVEGNRRVATIKWIMREAPPGITEETLTARRTELQKLSVLELETDENRLEKDRLLLQGICHMSPTRAWPAYARALACYTYAQRNLTPTQISRALGGGISPKEVGRLTRSYYAYLQMINDEEYGNYASAHRELLSYFSEVISRRTLRDDWLDWDDQQKKFTNDERREILYELIEGQKIHRMTDIRLLPKIIDQTPDAIDRLVAETDFSLEEAHAGAIQVERATTPPPTIPWRKHIRKAIEILEEGVALPFSNDDIELLQTAIHLAQTRLQEIQRFLGTS